MCQALYYIFYRHIPFHLNDTPGTGSYCYPILLRKVRLIEGDNSFAQDDTSGNVLAKTRSPD